MIKKYLFLAVFIAILPHQLHLISGQDTYMAHTAPAAPLSLSALQKRIEAYPETPNGYQSTIIPEHEILSCLEKMALNIQKKMEAPGIWLSLESPLDASFFDLYKAIPFQPYIQKIIIPEKSTLFLWGDTHGSIHSLVRCLQNLQFKGYIDDQFTILTSNTYLIFLGDFVDRGYYNVEVLYILMRLHIANPQNVILIRGNHEDINVNSNAHIGIIKQMNHLNYHIPSILYRLYDMLPIAAYLGCGNNHDRPYIMCCHGGPEIGVSPAALITAPNTITHMRIHNVDRLSAFKSMPKSWHMPIIQKTPKRSRNSFNVVTPTYPDYLGFMWNDFIDTDDTELLAYNPSRGYKLGKKITQYLIARDGGPNRQIKAIFRGHQHHGTMQEKLVANKGVVSLWNGLVYTLFSAPAIETHPRFSYDSFIQINTHAEYSRWQIIHHYNPTS